jgi:hypothetical protein
MLASVCGLRDFSGVVGIAGGWHHRRFEERNGK